MKPEARCCGVPFVAERSTIAVRESRRVKGPATTVMANHKTVKDDSILMNRAYKRPSMWRTEI
jgi:hypothetical protein